MVYLLSRMWVRPMTPPLRDATGAATATATATAREGNPALSATLLEKPSSPLLRAMSEDRSECNVTPANGASQRPWRFSHRNRLYHFDEPDGWTNKAQPGDFSFRASDFEMSEAEAAFQEIVSAAAVEADRAQGLAQPLLDDPFAATGLTTHWVVRKDAKLSCYVDAWEHFYANQTWKTYPLKNYVYREFPEFDPQMPNYVSPRSVIEIGCGAGSVLIPLWQRNPDWIFLGTDLAPEAVRFAQSNAVFTEHADAARHLTFEMCDILARPPTPSPTADICLMFFTLSSIHPSSAHVALRHAVYSLRPGGLFMFRDFGRFDYKHSHFSVRRQSRADAASEFFRRGDGTFVRFFSVEEVRLLLEAAGLQVLECEYHCNKVVNRRMGKVMHRVCVHAKAALPSLPSA